MYFMRNFPLCHLQIFFVWQCARVRGTGIIFSVVWKRCSGILEVGFGVLVMVTMRITVFIFLVWQRARIHGAGIMYSLIWKISSSRPLVGFGILLVMVVRNIAALWDLMQLYIWWKFLPSSCR